MRTRLGNFENVPTFVKRANGTLRGGLSSAQRYDMRENFDSPLLCFFHNGGFFLASLAFFGEF